MTKEEVGVNFRRAEQLLAMVLAIWKKDKWTREMILNSVLTAQRSTHGPTMAAFCYAVMAERLINQETTSMKEDKEQEPIKVNGRYYPLWSKYVHRKQEFIGLKLQDLTGSGLLPGDQGGETTITDITLTPNGNDSAMFCVHGEEFDCAFDVTVGGVGGAQEPGWLTFHGYGGHRWRIQTPEGK